MDYTYSVFTIKGINQKTIYDSYYEILAKRNILTYSFDSCEEFARELNRYCQYNHTEKSNGLLVLNVVVNNEDDYDLIDLQYLVELILKLKSLPLYESVMIAFDSNQKNYFRISQMLRLWYIFHAEKNSIWFRDRDIKTGKTRVKRIAVKSAANSVSDVLPLCQLSYEIWEVFSSDSIESESSCERANDFFSRYSELATNSTLSQQDILEMLAKEKGVSLSEELLYKMLISQYIYRAIPNYAEVESNSSCLAKFIFALFMKNKAKRRSKREMKIDERVAVFEVCCSYSQGIIQLIENALIHPPKESKSVSFFSFRANKHPERLKEYVKDTTNIENILEFSVSDIAISEKNANGIVTTFKNKHEGFDSVSLGEFFEFDYADPKKTLRPFYSEARNVVSHFGLQIFASVVVANNGCFSVNSDDCKAPMHYFAPKDSTIYNDAKTKTFFGTTYSVILPIMEVKPKELMRAYLANTPLDTIVETFEKDFGDYVLRNIPISNNLFSFGLEDRETNFQKMLEQWSLAYDLWGKPEHYCIHYNSDNSRSLVAFCKVLFIHMLKEPIIHNAVVFFDKRDDFLMAVRTYCLFFDRLGQSELMHTGRGLLLYSLEDTAHVYFADKKLDSIITGLSNQFTNGFFDSALKNQIEAIFGKQFFERTETNSISDVCIKLSVKNPITGKSLAEEELYAVLDRDIHDSKIGCKIPNTHFRLSRVHLDTYYEAQFLFGNSYWCKMFATYLANKIRMKILDKEENIIIYGYETYSSETLATARKILEKIGYKNIELLYFEKGDSESDSDRVRFVENLKYDSYKICYFVGISSTLSTFKQMNQVLCKKTASITMETSLCTSVIQIIEKPGSEKINLIHVLDGNTVEGVNLSFANEREASFLVSIAAEWYRPDNCKYCMTGDYHRHEMKLTNERPLIEVDETSVVPTLLYKPNDVVKPRNYYQNDYLKSICKEEVVYAEHLNRKGNHYEYFLRLAKIYSSHKNDIYSWLKALVNDPKFQVWKKKTNIEGSINIIVSPQQNCNNGFVDDINQIVFDGGAHTISFDIRKEYRETFVSKHSYLTKYLDSSRLKFYYVADHIISGKTFQRTKSLISSLFSYKEKSFEYSGIFVLINRSSYSSQESLVCEVDEYLPYFSFLNISIPSLRSYNCPACTLVSQYKTALKTCATNNIALEFQKSIIANREKNIKEIHEEYGIEKAPSPERMRQFRKNAERLLFENILWHVFCETAVPSVDDLVTIINKEIQKTRSIRRRIEALCVFLQLMTKPLLIYQETVKKVVFEFLHNVFFDTVLLLEGYPDCTFLKRILGDIDTSDNSCFYDLIDTCTWRLCSIGSTVFLFPDNIERYLNLFADDSPERASFEKKLISYIKFMIANDKLREFVFSSSSKLLVNEMTGAKSSMLINNLREGDKLTSFDSEDVRVSFWDLLYLESVSVESPYPIKHDKSVVGTPVAGGELDRLPQKYEALIQLIKSNEGLHDIEIEVYVLIKENTYCNLKDNIKIDLPEKCLSSIDKDGCFIEKQIHQLNWYIGISNNLSNFHINEAVLRDYIGSTNVRAIMKISTPENIDLPHERVRRVLLYRTILLDMLEGDYEEELFERSYRQKIMIDESRRAYSSPHGKNNWNDYQVVLDALFKLNRYEFFTLMDVFRKTFISYANFVCILETNMDDVDVTFNTDIKSLEMSLEVILQIVKYFVDRRGLNINYENEFTKIEGNEYEFLMLGKDTEVGYFALGALVYILLTNAERHADVSQRIDLCLRKNSNMAYDIELMSSVKAGDDSDSKTTVSGIKRLFERIRRNDSLFPCHVITNPKKIDGKYVIQITNIILKSED